MNLKDKIEALYNSTTSTDVKAICESFLHNDGSATKIAESSLLENLSTVRSKDPLVNELLNEQENLQNSIGGIESKISKNAAAKLMASWGGTGTGKVSNVGNHVNNVMIREKSDEVKKEKAIMEGLKAISGTDASADKMLRALSSGSFGVSESVDALRNSNISKHPQFKYILEKFDDYINSNIAESKIVRDYASSLSAFTWDKDVSESYTKIKTELDNRAVEIEVQNAIFDIKSTDSKGFFSSVVEKLNDWVSNDKRNVPALIKEMKPFNYSSIVNNLTNKLMLIENSKGTHFNIPVNSSNCTISSIYSPVIMKSGLQIFRAGDNFYAANKEGIHKMSEAQINALPTDFLSLCETFAHQSVKVVNDNIVMYVGKTKVTIGDTIKVNEQVVTVDNLGSTLMTYAQGSIFENTNPLVKIAVTLAENVSNIMEIDFGKAIFSSLYEGVGVYMFRRADKIFLNKVNPTMNENRFFEANGLQAVKFVKNFLSYNVSESLSDLLSGDAKKKTDMEKDLDIVMNNINILEGELTKIENAIIAQPEIADVQEVLTAKDLVSSELNNARASWQGLNTELKKFENADEEAEGEAVEITDEPAGDDSSAPAPTGDEPTGDDSSAPAPTGDEPTGDEPVGDAGTPAPTGDDAPVPADGVVDLGLAGAEGVQDQTQTIQGNDHPDANATATSEIPAPTGDGAEGIAAVSTTPQVVDAGFAGAEGVQDVGDTENLADVSAIPATSTSAELTIPANLMPNAQDTPPAPEETVISADVPVVNTEEPAPAGDAGDAGDAKAGEEIIPAAVAKGDGEEKSNEALDTSVQVKMKGSDRLGKITASNTVDHTYSVLWDDGETGEYSEDALEEIKPESADNQADNTEAAAAVKKVTEDEQAPEGSPANEPETAEVYVKATVAIDFGPYKEGEQLEINAGDFTAAGDDDPIKIKDPKEEIGTLPKKYIKIVDEAPKEEMSEVQSKLEGVVKNLEEIETSLKGSDKMESKSIEEALEKLRAFTGAISKDKK